MNEQDQDQNPQEQKQGQAQSQAPGQDQDTGTTQENSQQDPTTDQTTTNATADEIGHNALCDELGIEDIYDPMVGKAGKVFCTAGRDAPIAEFQDDFLILHPPQMPLDASDRAEEFTLQVDARGILLDEFGVPKKIPAATFKHCPIFCCGERKPGTLKHLAAALAPDGSLHAIFFEQGERLTVHDVYEMRNKSAEGDLSEFPEIVCDIE